MTHKCETPFHYEHQLYGQAVDRCEDAEDGTIPKKNTNGNMKRWCEITAWEVK